MSIDISTVSCKDLFVSVKKREKYDSSFGAELFLSVVLAKKVKKCDSEIYNLLDVCSMWEAEVIAALLDEGFMKDESNVLLQCMRHFRMFPDFVKFLKKAMEADLFSTKSSKYMKIVSYSIIFKSISIFAYLLTILI
jgi:hypothetical protein